MRNKHKIKTIGIVLPYLKSRGTEKQSLNISKGFLKQGKKVVLFNLQGWGDFSKIFRESGIEVVNVGPPLFIGEKRISKKRTFKLAYLSKKYKCDCLLSRAGMTNRVTAFAAKINSVPSIIVFSSKTKKPDLPLNKNFIKGKIKLMRFLRKNGFPDWMVTVSSEGADNLKSAFPYLSNRIVCIQNGVDLEDIQKKSLSYPKIKKTDRFRLCYSGSIEFARKGMDTLIDILYELVYKKGIIDIELLLIGAGDDEKALKHLVEKKRLKKNVIYAGEQRNPYPLVKNSDLFILPSRKEGLPNALLEAMALGVCSIAFDCPTGPTEIIENNKNGILVPLDDKVNMVNAIIQLKENPELRKRLSLNGEKTIKENFTYQKMINGYIRLIDEVLQ